MAKNNYAHILKYSGLFGSVQVLGMLMNILRNKFVAVLLGPGGMGLSGIFTSTTRLASDVANLGLPVSGVKSLSESYEKSSPDMADRVRLLRSLTLLTALGGMLLFIMLCPLIDHLTFSWGDHRLHFLLLSPVVGMTLLSGGELAVLKGFRRLHDLAVISVYHLIAALLVTVPIYYFWGISGIVPSLVLLSAAHLLIVYHYSTRLFPLRFSIADFSFLRKGVPMIKLGLAFVITGILGSGAEFFIRSYLNRVASIETVGLYTAAFSMMMTYAATALSSMDSDYFPRLSGLSSDQLKMNKAVNEQSEVSLLLMAPLVVFFITTLPVLLPLLYSGRFVPALDMLRIASLAMYIRAVKLPVEYIPLSKGDYRSHILLETVYFVFFVFFVLAGYSAYGLTGSGVGTLLNSLISCLFVYSYCRYKYDYRPSNPLRRYVLLQIPIGVFACAAAFLCSGVVYWILSFVAIVLSTGISVAVLKAKTELWNLLKNRFKRGGNSE